MLFMKHAERSTTFGSAFYSVSDTQQRQLTLAVNSRSIVQFDAANVYQPKKVKNFIAYLESSLDFQLKSSRQYFLERECLYNTRSYTS